MATSVAEVVLCLISIRRATFENCPTRFEEDYFEYKETGIYSEHPSMFYPVHPLIRYPKSYVVSGTTDTDYCQKPFLIKVVSFQECSILDVAVI